MRSVLLLILILLSFNTVKSQIETNYEIGIQGFFPYLDSNSQNIDSQAIAIFDSNLTIVKNIVFKIKDSKFSINQTIYFLSLITEIDTKVDFAMRDVLKPSIDQFVKWNHWFLENYHRLYWDEKEKKVKVNKNLSPKRVKD